MENIFPAIPLAIASINSAIGTSGSEISFSRREMEYRFGFRVAAFQPNSLGFEKFAKSLAADPKTNNGRSLSSPREWQTPATTPLHTDGICEAK
jgi:hypothetical protein